VCCFEITRVKIQRAGGKFGGIRLCSSIWGAEFRQGWRLRVVSLTGQTRAGGSREGGTIGCRIRGNTILGERGRVGE
jgi:hypothetical protein